VFLCAPCGEEFRRRRASVCEQTIEKTDRFPRLVLALLNLLLLSSAYWGEYMPHFLGRYIAPLKNLPFLFELIVVVYFICIPFVVLATVIFAIRDLLHPGTRLQALLALVLTVPIVIWYWIVKPVLDI
jgi:Na+/melibiose symporter-like transporter